MVVLDDTLCAHGGSLFDDVDRHDNQGDGTSRLVHHPVTRFSVSGPGRCPLPLRRYRRSAELTPWAAGVVMPVPDRQIPTDTQGRHRRHQPVEPLWLQAPECRARHEPCRTNIALAMALVEAAIRCQGPVGVVVCDAWDLAEDTVRVMYAIRRHRNFRGSDSACCSCRKTQCSMFRWVGIRPRAQEDLPLLPAPASASPLMVSPVHSSCVAVLVVIH
jgi:hypothetical protein